MEKQFYSIKEFAKILDVHENTVRNAIRNKKIETIRLGIGPKSGYRIAKSELSRMISFDLNVMIDGMIEKKMREKT